MEGLNSGSGFKMGRKTTGDCPHSGRSIKVTITWNNKISHVRGPQSEKNEFDTVLSLHIWLRIAVDGQ